MRRTWQLVATVAAAALLLAACTAWSGAGAAGGAVGAMLVLFVLLFAGGTQSGCIEDKPNPDPDEDAHVGPCLSQDAEISPCLTRIEPDFDVSPCLSQIEPDLGVCLGPLPSEPEPDAGVRFDACLLPDARMGPCLEAPIEDFGVDGPEPDFPLGPCLDTPPPDGDASAMLDPPQPAYAAAQRVDTRDRILDRLVAEGRLPDDVAARLKERRS